MISRDPFQLPLLCVSFSVKLFSYVDLTLRANADPYRPGFQFEHLFLNFVGTQGWLSSFAGILQ